jgi:DNA-binding NarL/FixJ family response regulator
VADRDRDRKIRQPHLEGSAKLRLPVLQLRPPMRLTPGERHVMMLLVQGKTDAQIAKERGPRCARC